MPKSSLELIRVRAVAAPHSGNWHVGLQDPGRSVMTDFNEHGLVSVAATQQIDEALEVMRHAGVRSAFVVDKARANVLGLITAYDIMGEKPILHVQIAGGAREDVVVSEIMDPIADWHVARLDDVDQATVGTILHTLQTAGRTHVPVVEEDAQHGFRLRGVFSAAKILRLTEAARRSAGKKRS